MEAEHFLRSLRERHARLFTSSDLADCWQGGDGLSAVISELEREETIEQVGAEAWLVLSHNVPNFSVPRIWSNRRLNNPEIIIALTVTNPSIQDITKLLLSYGLRRVRRTLEDLKVASDIDQALYETSDREIRNAWEGIRAAASLLLDARG